MGLMAWSIDIREQTAELEGSIVRLASMCHELRPSVHATALGFREKLREFSRRISHG
jgi:hypothetical protein